MRVLFDTNILIDFLAGVEAARMELALHTTPSISLITWMEVLVGARDSTEATTLEAFLRRFGRVPIDESVSALAVRIRREHRVRLPDAIIWASARHREAILVTRNTRDFPADHPGVRVPY